MKIETKLNKEILATTANIQENYPELSKFAEEMTVTIPSEQQPEINATTLKEYSDSLQAMVIGYANNSKKHIIIIGASFAFLLLLICPLR